MKHILFFLAAATLFVTSACSNSNPKESAGNTAPTRDTLQKKNGVTLLCEYDEALIIGLTDLENEMPAELFLGSYDDRLLDSLMPTGAARSAINAYLVIDSNHTVLFDAGIGADKGGRLMESLKTADVDPSKVTAVCLTHLHPDHIGGLLLDGKKAFPNATLYLSEEESDFNLTSGPLATNKLWVAVAEAYKGNIVTFRNGERLFDGLVVAELAPGHTPGHTVYHVAGICLVAGDLLHAQDLQLEHPQFCARYDDDPVQATTIRIGVLDRLRDGGEYLAGAHCYEHFIELGK